MATYASGWNITKSYIRIIPSCFCIIRITWRITQIQIDAIQTDHGAVPYDEFQRLMKNSDEAVLRRFDEARARIRERTASFSEEDIASDAAAARAELPI